VTALLELAGVEARYGPVKALHGVSLEVGEGEFVAVLGANGAGKLDQPRGPGRQLVDALARDAAEPDAIDDRVDVCGDIRPLT